MLWDRATGRPVAPAIVWQDRRTAERCRELDAALIRERTGLVPDPYFSATKLEWLLQRQAGGAAALAFGTVDSWLVWKLTGGEVHVTDATNASRTMLASLRTLDWDDDLLALFGVDRELLPRIVRSNEEVGEGELLGARLRIRGIAGDQQAALYGQGCHEAGEGKATYGTGSFVLVHSGRRRLAAAVRPAEDRCGRRLCARRGSAGRRRRAAVAARRARRPRRLPPRARRSRAASSRPAGSCSSPP